MPHDIPFGPESLAYAESIYQQYLKKPDSVDPEWLHYFRSWENPAGTEEETPPTGTYHGPVSIDPEPVIHRTATQENQKPIPAHIGALLKKVPMFSNVSEQNLTALAEITQEKTIAAHQFLCHEGQPQNDLLYLIHGSVAILRNSIELTRLGSGELIGELAVFDARPRSADIVTQTDCHLLRVAKADLDALLTGNNQLALELLKSLTIRLRKQGRRQESVDRLLLAYREHGHVMAQLDPLGLRDHMEHPELSLAHYGLGEADLDHKFPIKIGREFSTRSLREILATLQRIYCRSIGAQYMHIDDLVVQEWIRNRLEEHIGKHTLGRDKQLRILKKLTDAEVFERFLHRKFVGAKRFSLEGSESLIPLLDSAIEEAGNHQIEEVVIGMAHRGRLNVLVNVMGKSGAQVFREFQDIDPDLHLGKGDVKYHLGYGTDHRTSNGHKVHLSLCFNPSHLEFVGPVVQGRVRSKQDRFGDRERSRALPLLIHGDAAFIGQGVTQELFNLSELPGYSCGGTVHIILNNQIGFTTDPEDSRSSQYSTDVARMLQIPVFHVNGEDPEAVALVISLAMDFRKEFKKDVVIDMYGYRKYGHNEGDDPAFTQPLMVAVIKKQQSVRAAYVKNLLKMGEVTQPEADRIAQESKQKLELEYEKSHDSDYRFQHISVGQGLWSTYKGGPDHLVPEADTAVAEETLIRLLTCIASIENLPEGFSAHPKVKRFMGTQLDMTRGKTPLNWGTGEALALATLLDGETPVRLTGQDAERGTFSHRHAVLHDYKNGKTFTPLAHLHPNQGRFEIYNSPLSEIAVLGYEYGYSLDMPDGLTIWEAQFGDFCNVAQVIIDQFISSSEDKWSRLSGLCMFLPHGFEGQGPEHSSARLERFLMLSAEDNIQVVNLTTPAQLFHCLRRQVLRPLRKPLIVMSPKSLLRHPRAVSELRDLSRGRFHRILPDREDLDPQKTERILLCSGKIYYELLEKREIAGLEKVAIIRMEQYYPVPFEALRKVLKKYPPATPVYWVQEEPLNMGAWSFLKLRLGASVAGNGNHPLYRITRPESASPATGSTASHKIEQQQLIDEAFEIRPA